MLCIDEKPGIQALSLLPKIFRRLVTEFVKTGDTNVLHTFIAGLDRRARAVKVSRIASVRSLGVSKSLAV